MAPLRTPRSNPKSGRSGSSKSRTNRSDSKRNPRGKYQPRKHIGNPTTPGERIRAARLALGLTQSELAQHLRTDQTTISAWELGKSDKVAGPSLVALAMFLQNTPEAILDGTGFILPESLGTAGNSGISGDSRRVGDLKLPPPPPTGMAVLCSLKTSGDGRLIDREETLEEIRQRLSNGEPVWILTY